jgi:hypothetical protein
MQPIIHKFRETPSYTRNGPGIFPGPFAFAKGPYASGTVDLFSQVSANTRIAD